MGKTATRKVEEVTRKEGKIRMTVFVSKGCFLKLSTKGVNSEPYKKPFQVAEETLEHSTK